MIILPTGFDAVQLLSDFILFASPFVAISAVFAGYHILRRVLGAM